MEDQDPVRFLRPPLPAKHDPLPDRMVAGAPNREMARRREVTALSEAASLKGAAPVTHLEASSRYMIGFISLHTLILHGVPVGMPHGI